MDKNIDVSIFKDYDIRGIYPSQLNENVFYTLGKAIASYLKVREIAVGRDTRLSSPALFDSLAKGINSMGTDVVDLGMISTEIHYFASGYYQFPANIIISASHNPPEYNGLKIVTKGVVPLHGNSGLPQIKKLAEEGKFFLPEKTGKMRKLDVLPLWKKHVLSFVNISKLKPLKIVIDAGNGMGGLSWNLIKTDLPLEIIPLFFEPDGNFPNHLPDPLNEKNLNFLKKEIIRKKADLGFAIDGDADRLFVLDEKGQILSGTITTAVLAEELLKKHGKAHVLFNAVCGKIVPETIIANGGIPVRVRVGHSFIKEKMKELDALFAGEHSGHFYFRDDYYAESSVITGLIFLEYLSGQSLPLSQIADKFGKYPTSGEISFKADDASGLFKDVQTEYKDASKTDHLDGLSIFYPDWWFNLRASKTEPLLRLNVEADNRRILEKETGRLKNFLSLHKALEI